MWLKTVGKATRPLQIKPSGSGEENELDARFMNRWWLFTIYKKIPEIFVENPVRTVRIVYHLPKIAGLSRRARLDSSYNMKLQVVRNSRNL